MSESARFNAEAQLLQVRFASGGRGTPNTYAYSSIDEETWNDFMSGRWAENGTATAWFLTSWGGVRV
jgi:KTSC domain